MFGLQAVGDHSQLPARSLSAMRGLRSQILRPGRAFLGLGPSQQVTAVAPAEADWGWLPALSLTSALALVLIAFGLSTGDHAGSPKQIFFCVGAFLLFVPLCTRIAWPLVSRFEQMGLLLIAVGALFTIKLLGSPLGFTGFDELLHWKTADDILVRQTLFTPNELLPISPLYPGLEIAATALANVTGLPLFASALLLLAISRAIFICALFLFFEAVTASARVAAIACIVYMGNSSFPIFHTSFSYEGLAVVFLVLAFLATVRAMAEVGHRARSVALAAAFLLALAVTHHLTALIAIALLALLTMIVWLSRGALPLRRMALPVVMLIALFSAWGWLRLMGNPLTEYLLPALQYGLDDVFRLLKTWTPIRKPFVGVDGSVSPLWQRATMLCALALVCLGLAMGFFRALGAAGARPVWVRGRVPLSARWSNDWLVMLVLLTLVFPVTLAFRLTESAWELGNRLGPHVYLGVAPVVAFAVVCAWQKSSTRLWRVTAVGTALAVMLVGGLFTAWGGPIELPRHYKVVADALSIESMGIDAARWTKVWLGSDHRFVADRINRLLLTTYGRQEVVTSLQDQTESSQLVFAGELGPEELNTLKTADVDYLLVDMRMTQALPRLGVYFERGEDSQWHEQPPEPQALTKFNNVARVSRLFDNGSIIIYDVTSLVRYLRDER